MPRILLADDEEAVRDYVRRALEIGGHEVCAVQDGAEALAELARDPAYDLLLTDIRMPVLDGVALALKCAADYPGLPILMMTGYPAEKARAHNLDLLIHDILLKPFDLQALLDRVQAALDARPA